MKKLLHSILSLTVFIFIVQSTHAVTYTLTLGTNSSGTVSANPSLPNYPANSTVTVTATANSGYYFSNWSGNVSGTVSPLNVQMTNNLSVTANFAPLPQYTLTVTTNGGGGVTPSGGVYLSNSTVTLTATPLSGWIFTGWTGAATDTNTTLTLTMNGPLNVTANFVEPAAIDQAPANLATGVGGTVTFQAHAVGTAPMTYSWLFLSSPLSGQTTSNLTLTNVQTSQAGTYTFVASNAYGVASNDAVLTVTNSAGTNVVNPLNEDGLVLALGRGGVVTFSYSGTILVTNTIYITNDVIIDGSGYSITFLGGNSNQLFNVASNIHFGATNITFANGMSLGSNGVYAVGTGDGTPAYGGAIYSEGGNISLTGCILVSNSAVGGNGVQSYPTFGAEAAGGAIYLDNGTLQLNSTLFSSNNALGGLSSVTNTSPPARGGAIFTSNSLVSINDSVISNNLVLSAGGGSSAGTWSIAMGGGICVDQGSMGMTNTLLISNNADGGFQNNLLYQNVSGAAYGGGLAVPAGSAAIVASRIISNSATGGGLIGYGPPGPAQGGGIYAGAFIVISNSTISANTATAGGGGYPATDGFGGGLYSFESAAISGTTFSSNIAAGGVPTSAPGGYTAIAGTGGGGGICNSGTCYITNSTFSLNGAIGGNTRGSMQTSGGGVGGGILNSNGILFVMNVTIASNYANPGLGQGVAPTNIGSAWGANLVNSNGTVTLVNSILAYPGTNGNVAGTITDGGYNMSSDGSAGFASGTSFNDTDPLLHALSNNGGPTLTMALDPASPAVDFGTSSGAPGIDQRGYVRPALSGYDMGAFELESSDLTPLLRISQDTNGITLSFDGYPDSSYAVQSTSNLNTPSWSTITSFGPLTNDATITFPILDNRTSFVAPGNFFRVKVQ